jgi:hypothetical protein
VGFGDSSRMKNLKPMRCLVCLLFALPLMLLSTGCVTGRRSITLPVPVAGALNTNKGNVTMGEVRDARVFEQKPADPSTPSVKGNLASMSAAEKSRMIGRQRNSYGKAMGDVSLPVDDSVIKRTQALLTTALAKRGYKVGGGAGQGDGQPSIDVTIDRFWAWFSPGMFTVRVTQNGQASEFIAAGYGLNKGQVASDANWQLAYERAFADLLLKLDTEFAGAGL